MSERRENLFVKLQSSKLIDQTMNLKHKLSVMQSFNQIECGEKYRDTN